MIKPVARPPGRLSFYDTSLHIWEEPVNPNGSGLPKGYEEAFTNEVFAPLRQFLRGRDWIVARDPRGKDYAEIAKWMWLARHGDLQMKLYLAGRTIEMAFFQDLVHEHPSGGIYDHNKFLKMPYLVRKRFLAEAAALIRYLTRKFGYAGPELGGPATWPLPLRLERTSKYSKHTSPSEDPLRAFNDSWDSEFEKKRGVHRFERDETGWPSRKELSYGYTDREGVYVEPGAVRYLVDYKNHIIRGRAYPNMNGMYVFVYGPGLRDNTQTAAGRLFTPQPGESLRRIPNRNRIKRLKEEQEKAAYSHNFERALLIRDLIKREAAEKTEKTEKAA